MKRDLLRQLTQRAHQLSVRGSFEAAQRLAAEADELLGEVQKQSAQRGEIRHNPFVSVVSRDREVLRDEVRLPPDTLGPLGDDGFPVERILTECPLSTRGKEAEEGDLSLKAALPSWRREDESSVPLLRFPASQKFICHWVSFEGMPERLPGEKEVLWRKADVQFLHDAAIMEMETLRSGGIISSLFGWGSPTTDSSIAKQRPIVLNINNDTAIVHLGPRGEMKEDGSEEEADDNIPSAARDFLRAVQLPGFESDLHSGVFLHRLIPRVEDSELGSVVCLLLEVPSPESGSPGEDAGVCSKTLTEWLTHHRDRRFPSRKALERLETFLSRTKAVEGKELQTTLFREGQTLYSDIHTRFLDLLQQFLRVSQKALRRLNGPEDDVPLDSEAVEHFRTVASSLMQECLNLETSCVQLWNALEKLSPKDAEDQEALLHRLSWILQQAEPTLEVLAAYIDEIRLPLFDQQAALENSTTSEAPESDIAAINRVRILCRVMSEISLSFGSELDPLRLSPELPLRRILIPRPRAWSKHSDTNSSCREGSASWVSHSLSTQRFLFPTSHEMGLLSAFLMF